METEFYTVSDNSFRTRGTPWIFGAYADERILSECPICKTRVTEPGGTIQLTPDPEKGSFWPDALGCGGGLMGLYVSERVKQTLDSVSARYGKAFPALVQQPYPRKLRAEVPPRFFQITGEFGAKLDFAASGYRIKSTCPSCGNIKVDHLSTPRADRLVDGSWTGSDIFYTDLSPGRLFCSSRILALAGVNRWSNFRFLTLDDSHNYGHKGIDYLKN